ncbi:MAG: hypothetical protein PHV37_10165, partial [Candidatus Gastranaerophilales bacterium]|nr:hypothetical protein [Candidatus Gastranaerophilales bacterium]
MKNIKKDFKCRFRHKKAFSIAEALVTLMIVSLMLSAIVPVVAKKYTTTDKEIWKYTENNSDIYYGLGDSQTAVIGANKAPLQSYTTTTTDADGNTTTSTTTGSSGARLSIVTPASTTTSPTIQRSLIDFSEKTSSGTKNIGKISFDTHLNTAVGKGALLSNTTGIANTANGNGALFANTTG